MNKGHLFPDMAANGVLVIDPITGLHRYPRHGESNLLHVQVQDRQHPTNSGTQGRSLQRPPLHGIPDARLQPQVDAQNASSFAGFTWGKENNASNVPQARACGLQATAFNQSYNEEPYLAPYQPSLPSTSSLQYAHPAPIHPNASFPLPLSQRGFEQDTPGLRNGSAEATTFSDGLGLGTSSSSNRRYHEYGEYSQVTAYNIRHALNNQYSGGYASSAERQRYRPRPYGASKTPHQLSSSSQLMTGSESHARYESTQVTSYMPTLRGQTQRAVACHTTNGYQSISPAIVTEDTHHGNELNSMDSQLTPMVPTPEEQNQDTVSSSGPDVNEWIMKELTEQEALSKDTGSRIVHNHVTANEGNSVAPKHLGMLNRLNVSELIPSSIERMSVYELFKASGQDAGMYAFFEVCPVHTLAETLLKEGWSVAQVREEMEAWAAQVDQVAEQRVPPTPASAPRYVCTLDGCGKTFANKQSLSTHQKTTKAHNNGVVFICERCGQDFTRKDSLERHDCKQANIRVL